MGNKRTMEYDGAALGLIDVDLQTEQANNGNIIRLNQPHAVAFFWDIANTDDDANVGAFSIEFDVYAEDGATIIWTGALATAISSVTDDKGCVVFGGGVNADTSDGTLDPDASVLQIFNHIRFRINVTTANDDTGTSVLNCRIVAQE